MKKIIDQVSLNQIIICLIVGTVLLAILERVFKVTLLSLYFPNIVSEFIGIVITYLILEKVIEKKNKQLVLEELIEDFQSRANDVAVHAAERLNRKGYLHDGSLNNRSIARSNLRYAELSGIEMNNVTFIGADFTDAALDQADFTGSTFLCSYLYGTDFEGTDLYNTKFTGSYYDSNTKWPIEFDPKKAGATIDNFRQYLQPNEQKRDKKRSK